MPFQERSAPSTTLFGPTTVASQRARSVNPGTTPPNHEPERLKSVALFALVMTFWPLATPVKRAIDPTQTRCNARRKETGRKEVLGVICIIRRYESRYPISIPPFGGKLRQQL